MDDGAHKADKYDSCRIKQLQRKWWKEQIKKDEMWHIKIYAAIACLTLYAWINPLRLPNLGSSGNQIPFWTKRTFMRGW